MDDGYSGANPHRPGLERISELAEAGAIDLVIATKRDRFFRSRLHRLLWQRDLEEYGVEPRALNDTGNRLADGFMDDFAEYERDMIRERTQAGLREKARQGRVIASATPSFGFRYTEDRDGLVVDAEEMRTAHRIIETVADGTTIWGMTEALSREGVRGPRSNKYPEGAPRWNRVTVRNVVLSDLYRPHTVAELEAKGVAPEVLTRLDPQASYGLWFYQGIPIPTPDSGIQRELIDRARAMIRDNRRASNAGHRFWTLSGGIARCATCEATLETSVARGRNPDRPYFYYRCNRRYTRGLDECPNNCHHPAADLERRVSEAVSAFLDDEGELTRVFAEGADFFRSSASEKNRERLAGHLTTLESRRSTLIDLASDGTITREDLRAKLAEADAQRGQTERGLAALQRDAALADQIEALGATLVEGSRQGYWRQRRGSKSQRDLYRRLGLRAEVDERGNVELTGAFGEGLGVMGFETTPSPSGTTNTSKC